MSQGGDYVGTRRRIGFLSLFGLVGASWFTLGAQVPVAQAAAAITDTVALACNNTFNASKFPLEYRVVATPSANPVAPGATFTVSFNVTVIASAGFLNAVYTALGQVSAIPITADQATIVPASGATGAAVVAKLTSTFTIPKPAVTPVTVGQEIPLGSVTGTYTAAATGPITFQFEGNAFAPAIGATAADPRPSGVTEPAWTVAAGKSTLTASGLKTYTTASLLSGLVKPSLVCMPGSWTQGGTVAAPTFANPWIPPTKTFTQLSIGTPSTTAPATTAPATTAPATTAPATTAPGSTTPGSTAPATTAPATTAPATTEPGTTDPGTTTPVSEPTTTTPTTDPATTTTVPTEDITGDATYSVQCKDSLVQSTYTLTFDGVITAPSPVAAGQSFTIIDQSWDITIPDDLATTLRGVLGADFDADITVTLNATNASPAKATSSKVTVPISLGDAGPALITVDVPEVTFMATGAGPIDISFGGSITEVSIGGTPAQLTCGAPSSPESMLRVESYGTPVATTTTTVAGATTTSVSSGAGGGGGGGGGAGGGSLGNTGSPLENTWLEIFAALAVLQVGIWLWAVGSRRRSA